MTKASDNDFPSMLLTEQGSAPTSPAASHQRLYIRTSDHTLVTVNSSGTVTPVGGAASTTFIGCKAYNNTTQSIGSGTMTACALNAEEFDTSTFHDNATFNTRLTVPTTGYYLFNGYVYFVNQADQKNQIVQLYKNNTTAIRSQPILSSSAASSTGAAINISAIISLAANDYIEMRAYATAASTIGDGTNTEQQNFLSCVLLGT